MPLFEYRCGQCTGQFELLVRGSDAAKCPECGSGKLARLISEPATPMVGRGSLAIANGCPPADAPPCSPRCCRLPQ